MPAGDLDTSFGTGGIVTTQFPSIGTNGSQVNGIALQGDGKIVAAGYADLGSGSSNFDFALARYNTDGTLDTTGFGSSGLVTTNLGSTDDEIKAVAIQSNGKIVAAGFSGSTNAAHNFAVARYNSDGTLDTTGFGSPNGYVITDVSGTSKRDEGQAIAIQGDGKIVVSGFAQVGSNFKFAVVRYNSDGTLDTGFGTGGIALTSFGSVLDESFGVAIQADGKVVAVGQTGNSNLNFAAARYSGTDGSLDSGFGTSGKFTLDLFDDDHAQAVAIQADGKIVIVGYTDVDGSDSVYDFVVIRLNTNGTLDTTGFGSPNGYVTVSFGTNEDLANAVAIQSDGKILVAGSSGGTGKFGVARLATDGSLDSTFGTAGLVTTTIGTHTSQVFAVLIQPDSKFVAAGGSHDSGNVRQFALARYSLGSSPSPFPPTTDNSSSFGPCGPDLTTSTAALTYAGVQISLPTPQQVDWLSRTFTLRTVIEFSRTYRPGPRMPYLTFPGQLDDQPLKLSCLRWPRDASRFATFHGIVTDAQLAKIRASGAPLSPKRLVMQWLDGATGTVQARIAPCMWMLPPLPLSQITGQNGTYLLTLVDDRYWWWYRPEGTVTIDEGITTWDDLYAQLSSALGISFAYDTINPNYLLPSRFLTSNYEYLPLLLDACAYNVGQRIVAYLNGNVYGRGVVTGGADIAANLALPAARSKVAGGAFLPSDVQAAIPATALVAFPEYAGDVVLPTPYVATGATGGTANAVKSFHDTANYDGSNGDLLNALAVQIALDYGFASSQAGDWKFAGIVPWVPETQTDEIEWILTADGGPNDHGEVTTRIYPGQWNDLTDQLLHDGGAGSSLTNVCCTNNTENTTNITCPITVVNDCNLRTTPCSPGFGGGNAPPGGPSPGLYCFVYNLCDNTLNLCVGGNWVYFCPCGTQAGYSLGPSYGTGPCLPGTCNLCATSAPASYTLSTPPSTSPGVTGFTGSLAVLNGPWTLLSAANCRWSFQKTVAGKVYYSSFILGTSGTVLGFLNVTDGITMAVYSGLSIRPATNCCLTSGIDVTLQSFDHGSGGGGTNTACTTCVGNITPLQWTVPLGGMTGDLAPYNAVWSLAWTGGCDWSARDSLGNVVALRINNDGVGDNFFQLTLSPAGKLFSAFWTGIFVAGQLQCCQVTRVTNPDFGGLTATGPNVILMTPNCEGGTNNAPPLLHLTPLCCPTTSGGSGGSSGGGGNVTSCCPGLGLPNTLILRLTGTLLAISPVTLAFNGATWTASVGGCGGTINLVFSCDTLSGSFLLSANGAAVFSGQATASNCTSLIAFFASGGNTVGGGLCAGAFTWAVTPT